MEWNGVWDMEVYVLDLYERRLSSYKMLLLGGNEAFGDEVRVLGVIPAV